MRRYIYIWITFIISKHNIVFWSVPFYKRVFKDQYFIFGICAVDPFVLLPLQSCLVRLILLKYWVFFFLNFLLLL